jgi:hypothetical protein
MLASRDRLSTREISLLEGLYAGIRAMGGRVETTGMSTAAKALLLSGIFRRIYTTIQVVSVTSGTGIEEFTVRGKLSKLANPRKASLFVLAILFVVSFAGCSKPEPEPAPSKTATPAGISLNGSASLTADPNPVIVTDNTGLGETVVNWKSNVARVDIRVESFNGKLFASGGSTGSARTGKWVRKGSKFFMQDHDAADPTSAAATLATLTVDVR